MSKRMAKLYEKAWNQVVDKLPAWKKEIVVNHKDDAPEWERISREVSKETMKLAESWDYASKTTTPSPY